MLGKIICASIPNSSKTAIRAFGSYAPRWASSTCHTMSDSTALAFLPSAPITAPAAAWPMATPSITHTRCPSMTSWWGTRPFRWAGANRVNKSAGSDQCESASTTKSSDKAEVMSTPVCIRASRATAAHLATP